MTAENKTAKGILDKIRDDNSSWTHQGMLFVEYTTAINAMQKFAAQQVAKATKDCYPKEFVEWKDDNKVPFNRQINQYDFNGCYHTLDELFNYWKENMK